MGMGMGMGMVKTVLSCDFMAWAWMGMVVSK